MYNLKKIICVGLSMVIVSTAALQVVQKKIQVRRQLQLPQVRTCRRLKLFGLRL